jgi:hypothetical protein
LMVIEEAAERVQKILDSFEDDHTE